VHKLSFMPPPPACIAEHVCPHLPQGPAPPTDEALAAIFPDEQVRLRLMKAWCVRDMIAAWCVLDMIAGQLVGDAGGSGCMSVQGLTARVGVSGGCACMHVVCEWKLLLRAG
jgi:hypothetical protein